MGLFDPPPTMYFYLVQDDKRSPYRRMGPYDLDTLALIYKEEGIDHKTMVWTNDRVKMRGKIRKQRIEGWNAIGDMPEEWQMMFRPALSRAPDRGVNRDPFQTVQQPAGAQEEQPPSMPAV